MNEKQQKGSETAKQGFINEEVVVEKFNNWQTDSIARDWLLAMNYNLNEIQNVVAVKIHGFKTDVQIQVTITFKNTIDVQNLQVKLVSQKKGFNQIDKRWIVSYQELWGFSQKISTILKKFTGEILPSIDKPKNRKRMFIFEFTDDEQTELKQWLESNKSLIVSDVLKGRGQFAAEWMLVIRKSSSHLDWVLKPMNYCLNHFGNEEIVFTPRGSIRIGKITVQRKGGDNGRSTANMLQFKIDPTSLFT
ncbi:MAG: type II restriction endonuclease [Candidatus Kapabacteria bacterium]|nr:type II restriction endonuclease [Candidatus Kapabacteria bacterium]